MILIKEEFFGCEKYVRAMKIGGSDAIVMWGALKCYASKNPRLEGFIPDEDIDGLVGAPRQARKALKALVECGGLLRDGSRRAGLVEAVEGGWQLHDYLDHANAPEDEELRREKQRLKKQRQREEKRRELASVREQALEVSRLADLGLEQDRRGHEEGDSGGHVPGDTGGQNWGDSDGDTTRDVPGPVLARPRPPAPARPRAPAHVGARSQPNPPQPSPPHEREIPEARAHADARFIPKTFTMPSEEPPKDYLDEALMAGVKPEQAKSTWKHYWKAGLPEHGVEKLHPWLIGQAIEYAKRTARIEPKGAPRPAEDPGTRGHERLEPQGEHRRIAEEHGLKLEEFVEQVRKHPRAHKMSTVQQWELLTKLLSAAADRRKRGAA